MAHTLRTLHDSLSADSANRCAYLLIRSPPSSQASVRAQYLQPTNNVPTFNNHYVNTIAKKRQQTRVARDLLANCIIAITRGFVYYRLAAKQKLLSALAMDNIW